MQCSAGRCVRSGGWHVRSGGSCVMLCTQNIVTILVIMRRIGCCMCDATKPGVDNGLYAK